MVDKTILKKLKISTKKAQLNDWRRVVKAKLLPEKEIKCRLLVNILN